MNFKDLSYLNAAVTHYLKHLQDIDEEDVTEDEFSEIQEDVVYLDNLLFHIQESMDALKRPDDTSPPELRVVDTDPEA